ncbi:YopX family protein [Bacillus mycoides]|uniref:YopX family protein n=1 Tax=Bacillus mycoides TaxID=1405 RepID=UPI003D071FF7
MKEIKLRVWDKVYKYFLEGDIIRDYIIGELIDDPDREVMQYTGINDLHGNEIYEGDIVRNAFREEYKIIWCEKRYQFIAVTTIEDGSEWYQNVSRSLEVIGNIYENSTK